MLSISVDLTELLSWGESFPQCPVIFLRRRTAESCLTLGVFPTRKCSISTGTILGSLHSSFIWSSAWRLVALSGVRNWINRFSMYWGKGFWSTVPIVTGFLILRFQPCSAASDACVIKQFRNTPYFVNFFVAWQVYIVSELSSSLFALWYYRGISYINPNKCIFWIFFIFHKYKSSLWRASGQGWHGQDSPFSHLMPAKPYGIIQYLNSFISFIYKYNIELQIKWVSFIHFL